MRQLSWREAIEQVLRDNGGMASLDVLYRDIPKHRDVTTNREWKATLRGILYREMQQRGNIVRVGLGVFALKDAVPKQRLFQRIIRREEIQRHRLTHTDIEGMLVELGNSYGYDTYTADAHKVFDGKPLAAIATLKELPPFTFPEVLAQVRQIDVLWFERKPNPFPKFAFEVETTPNFRRALLRLYQLRNFDTTFYIIADSAKQGLLEKCLREEPFHAIRHRVLFRSIEEVLIVYQLKVRLAEEEAKFFGGRPFRH